MERKKIENENLDKKRRVPPPQKRKEKAEQRRENPKFLAIRRLLDENVYKDNQEESFEDPRIDTEKTLKILKDLEDEFDAYDTQDEALLNATPELPQLTEEQVADLHREVNQIIVEAGFLPENLLQGNELTINFSLDRDYARYMDIDTQKIFGQPEEQVGTALIQLGGKLARRDISRIKERLSQKGLEAISDDKLLRLVLSHALGHELNHHAQHQMGDKDEGLYQKASATDHETRIEFDDVWDRNAFYSELLSQSSGDLVLQGVAKKMGLDEKATHEIRDILGRRGDTLADFRNLAIYGKQLGFSTEKIATITREIYLTLKKQGHQKEAERVHFNWRTAGYFGQSFNELQLQYIFREQQHK